VRLPLDDFYPLLLFSLHSIVAALHDEALIPPRNATKKPRDKNSVGGALLPYLPTPLLLIYNLIVLLERS
jgi:hypothetical protein